MALANMRLSMQKLEKSLSLAARPSSPLFIVSVNIFNSSSSLISRRFSSVICNQQIVSLHRSALRISGDGSRLTMHLPHPSRNPLPLLCKSKDNAFSRVFQV